MQEFFGLLGLALILIGWLPEVAETIKTGKSSMKKEFIALYFFGSASLAAYAWQLNALPFIILNIAAATVPLINLYYLLKPGKKEAKK